MAELIPDTDDDDIPLEPRGGGRSNGHANADETLDSATNGIGNSNTALSPVHRGEIHHQSAQTPVEYEIVETDDSGRPLNGQQTRGDDRLSAQEGDGTYLEQQQQRRAREEDPNLSRGQRRREQQKRSRQFNERENQMLRDELNALRQRVDGIQPHLSRFDASQRAGELARIDGEINNQQRILADAQNRITEAVKKIALGETGAEDEFKKAQTDSYQAVVRGQNAVNAKAIFEQQTRQLANGAGNGGDQRGNQQGNQDQRGQQQTEGREPVITERAKRLSKEFAGRHPWIDVKGSDITSRLAMGIDQSVLNDGFNPESTDYWDELEDRLAEAFPHKFADQGQQQRQPARQAQNGNGQRQPAQNQTQQRRGPMTGSSEGNAPRRQQVLVTPERKRALLQAGVIEETGRVTNKAKFDRIMRSYTEFDAQNRATQ